MKKSTSMRNKPCPCGRGTKFKYCHGNLVLREAQRLVDIVQRKLEHTIKLHLNTCSKVTDHGICLDCGMQCDTNADDYGTIALAPQGRQDNTSSL